MSRRIHILEIKSITVKKFKPLASNQYVCSKEYKKLLEQDFKALEPGIKWVGDITYIHIEECGWTYLATVMDLFDLKIIGWEYSTTMTDDLAVKDLEKAYKARIITRN